MNTAGGQDVPKAISDLGARLGALEGRFASSWACQTRDEYEKTLKAELKQQIMDYVTKIAIGLLVFLGGVGALFIKLSIDATYQTENKKVIENLQKQYDTQVKDDRVRSEWQRHHNYGVTYRYLAELYSNSNLSPDAKTKALNKMFDRAQTYYLIALRQDPRQPTTHFEIAQLHYTYALQFGLPSWHNDDKALEEYQQAVDFASQDDVSKGWRAESLTMIGAIELEEFKLKDASSPNRKDLLDRSETHLKQARNEYEREIPEVVDYNKSYLDKTSSLLREIADIRRGLR